MREREWEAAHTIWLWPDRSPSMAFASRLARESKLDRALVIAFALAEILVEAGERVGLPGLMRPTGSRAVIDRMARGDHPRSDRAREPAAGFAPASLSEIVVLSDLWSPIEEIRAILTQLSSNGAQGHLVQIVDPAEETFPYSGRIEFIEPEGVGEITAGRAETWRADYEARLERHRDEIRAETASSAGASPSTAPTARRANCCWRCMPASATATTPPASNRRPHGMAPARSGMIGACRSASRSRWCCSACSACRCCGGCCGSFRRGRAASSFRRRGCCSTSCRRKTRRRARRGG